MGIGTPFLFGYLTFYTYVPGPFIKTYHIYLLPFLTILCNISYYWTCTSDPGVISSKIDSILALPSYLYDNYLFIPDKECQTCKLIKPARSKHCSICNHCVLKFDHHCIWLNKCIGKNNY